MASLSAQYRKEPACRRLPPLPLPSPAPPPPRQHLNFSRFMGANILKLPALGQLTLNHWAPQWWQVGAAGGWAAHASS